MIWCGGMSENRNRMGLHLVLQQRGCSYHVRLYIDRNEIRIHWNLIACNISNLHHGGFTPISQKVKNRRKTLQNLFSLTSTWTLRSIQLCLPFQTGWFLNEKVFRIEKKYSLHIALRIRAVKSTRTQDVSSNFSLKKLRKFIWNDY